MSDLKETHTYSIKFPSKVALKVNCSNWKLLSVTQINSIHKVILKSLEMQKILTKSSFARLNKVELKTVHINLYIYKCNMFVTSPG
jgi:hypothetical protein